MPIVLSHKSALITLLRNRSISQDHRHCFPLEVSATEDDVEYYRRAFQLGISAPDALITQRKQRFHLPDSVQVHYAKNLTDIPAFLRLDDVYLASPELLFVQFAASMTLVEAILFGYYLCGDYRPSEQRFETGDQPLTSADRLRAFIDALPQTHGKAKAAQAVQFVIDNSNSPQESRLTIILILPRRLGGYALLRPHLNQLIPGTTKRGDLCWLDHGLILEYDSAENHDQEDQRQADAARRVKIELGDYRVISVSPQITHDLESLDELAELTRLALKQPLRAKTPGQKECQAALHQALFGGSDLPF